MDKLKLGDQTYYGIEDFILRAKVEDLTAVNQETGETMNTYEFFWKLFQKVLQESEDE